MRGNGKDDNILNELIDVITQLLDKNQSQTVNPPIPSVSNINRKSKKKDLVITKEEAQELLHTLEQLGKELSTKNKLIRNLQEDKKEAKQSINRLKEDKKSNYQKESIKGKNLIINCSFKEELNNHLTNFDFITVIIVAGQDCCELSGHLCRLYNDFIVLVKDEVELIKIPIDKIAAIKVNNNNGRKQRYKHDNLDNNECDNDNSSFSKEDGNTEVKENEGVAAISEMDHNSILKGICNYNEEPFVI